jgi:hypothetical protein
MYFLIVTPFGNHNNLICNEILRLAVKFNKNVIKEILDFQKSLAGLVG